MVTKGCATETECLNNSTNTIYDETTIQVGGNKIGGMSVTASCCTAEYFDNDDEVAVNYAQICNSASTGSGSAGSSFMVMLCISITTLLSVCITFL